MVVAVINQVEVKAATSRVVLRLSDVYQQTQGLTLATTPDGTRVWTRLQVIFALQFHNPVESMIYESIITHALNAEKMGPGGFDSCIDSLLRAFNASEALPPNNDLKTLLDALDGSGTRRTTLSDLNRIVSANLDPKLHRLVTSALELAGFGGRIIIEKARADLASVELLRGCSFSLKPAFACSAQLLEPMIACIDGFVESVSEIHLLLETTSQAKVPVLLFARGLAPEVISTLKMNYDRGSLKVVPFIVPFDLEGINTTVDIAIASGTDVLSSNKGQLISTLQVSDLKPVSKATVYPNRVVIINSRSRGSIRSHVAHLKERRATTSDDSLGRLIDLRIKSLSPNQVVIRLPDDDMYVVMSQSIDYVLRNIKALGDHGIWKEKPASSFISGQINASRCVDFLRSLGSAITS